MNSQRKPIIVELLSNHPDWTALRIARECGCTTRYVRMIAKECGFELPSAGRGVPGYGERHFQPNRLEGAA